MPKNKFEIKVLEDGMLCIETEDFSPEVHKQADDLAKHLSELMGGEVTIKEKRSHAKQHTHSHTHGGVVHKH